MSIEQTIVELKQVKQQLDQATQEISVHEETLRAAERTHANLRKRYRELQETLLVQAVGEERP